MVLIHALMTLYEQLKRDGRDRFELPRHRDDSHGEPSLYHKPPRRGAEVLRLARPPRHVRDSRKSLGARFCDWRTAFAAQSWRRDMLVLTTYDPPRGRPKD